MQCSVFLLIWDFGLFTLYDHNYFLRRYFFFFFFLGQSRGWWFNLLLLPGRRSNLALSKHCGLHNRCLVFLSCVSVYVCMSLLMHVCVCVCVVWMCECVLQATDVVLLVPLGFQRVYKYVNVQWENTRTVRFPSPHTPRGSVDLFITFCEGVSRFCSSFCFSTQMSFSFNIVFAVSLFNANSFSSFFDLSETLIRHAHIRTRCLTQSFLLVLVSTHCLFWNREQSANCRQPWPFTFHCRQHI